jgi:Rha family phage regulatory protein
MKDSPDTPAPQPPVPVVFAKEGGVFALSQDVAAFFGKPHRSVLRAIDDLIAQEASLTPAQFCAGVYTLPNTRTQEHRMFRMTRDGFTLLAMGFNGAKALQWKLRYIEAFNRLEAEIRAQPPAPTIDLMDPAQLRGLLLSYGERAEAMQQQVIALETQVEGMAEDVAAHERQMPRWRLRLPLLQPPRLS